MAIALASAAICLQLGFRNLDTARKTSAVVQAIQDEGERLRLLNWTAIEQLPPTATIQSAIASQLGGGGTLSDLFASGQLQITRTIANVHGFADMKHIQISATWVGIDGRSRTRILQMRYAKGGTSDYYYGVHL